MSDLSGAFTAAFAMIVHGDAQLVEIVSLSLAVSLAA